MNPHRHKHEHRHMEEEIVWKYGDEVVDHPDQRQETVTSTEAPFSNAETLVWDWQAIALTSAVCACILFFLAITLYSLHQAKQWRRLKDNFDAGRLVNIPKALFLPKLALKRGYLRGSGGEARFI